MGRLRRALVASGLLLALTPAAASAGTSVGTIHTVTASEGTVTAQLRYEEPPASQAPAGLQLTIERGGAQLYQAPVSSPRCSPCRLEELGTHPLLVRDLEGHGEPSVILELNSGGAHCCTIVQVLSLDPGTTTYRAAERDFGDPAALVRDLAGDGALEFETADDRFAYVFAPFAYSGLPLQLLAFREGRFVDVTRSFPAALAKDATKWMQAFRSERRHGLGNGLIAAWAADEELLGHDGLVRSTLAREARHRNLRSREHYGPSGERFVEALLRFLKHTGYRR